MKILQIHNRYRDAGGEDAVVGAEAEVLRQAGHVVHQLIQNNSTGDLTAAGALLLAPWNPMAARSVSQIIDEVEPDVAHIHNTWFTLSPAIFRTLRKRKVPVVVTLHNYRVTCANALLFRDGAPCELCIGANPWQAVRYACYRDSRIASLPAAATVHLHRLLGTWVNNVDVFIALTDIQRKVMIRAGLPSEKILVKPHFVSDPGDREKSPSQSNLILYAGRLSEEKGVRLLLDAWGEARPPGLELLIAGDGPERTSLEHDPPNGVRILGHLSPAELTGVMLEARALVMPSLWHETFGRVVAEAFAAGLPTAVSDGGGSAEIVTQALGPRWLFRSGDQSALCEMLLALADNEWCNSSGRMARQAFLMVFTRDQAVDRLLHVYSSARNAVADSNRPSRPSDSLS